MFEFSFPRYGICIGVKVTADPAWMQSLPVGLVLTLCLKRARPIMINGGPAKEQHNKRTRYSSSVPGTSAICRAWPSVLAPWILCPVGGFESHGTLKLVLDLVWASLPTLAPWIIILRGD